MAQEALLLIKVDDSFAIRKHKRCLLGTLIWCLERGGVKYSLSITQSLSLSALLESAEISR